MKSPFERYHEAREIRNIRKILRNGQPVIEPSPKSSIWGKIGFALLITGLVILGSCSLVHAYTDQEAIKTIVGEASNQGYKGMVCVGEVIRHNSTLKPFYGFKAMNHRHEPVWVWKQATRAWYASKTSNLTRGANHFENINAFGEPFWVKSCVLTFEYRDHKFYREAL